MAQRSNEKHREVFLVATGNQAMLKTGNISGSGSAVTSRQDSLELLLPPMNRPT